MPFEARLVASLGLALAVVYWATPVAIRLAARFDFYDKPAGYKGHAHPTPYLGGAAVVSGFTLATLLFSGSADRTLPLVGGVLLLWAVGTVDDRRHVGPWLRVAVEVGLSVMLWSLGLGWDLGAGGAVDLAVTTCWIVGVVNALNLFDNMDGAAASMAGVLAAGLAVLGLVQGDHWLAITGVALSGACIGFLPYNLRSSPARIFLGDGGSMPVGFAAAALAMIGVSGAAAQWESLAIGLLFVGVPLLDTSLVMISRTRRGVSILTGGRDHLTHRARRHLRTPGSVALTLGISQVVLSALAIGALEQGSLAVAAAVLLYALATCIAIAFLDTHLAPDPPAMRSAADLLEASPRRRRLPVEVLAPALLVPLCIGAGLSPLFSGFYSSTIWAPIGLGLVVATIAAAIARPVSLSRAGVLCLGGLTGLALLSLTSALWADSAEQAIVEGNRLLVYAVALGLLLLLVRTDRSAVRALATLAVASLVIASTIVGDLLSGDTGVFLAGRLDRPLGYINGEGAFFLLAVWPCLAAAERARSAPLAGAGAAGTDLFACLALLSQSRGVALAAAAGVVAVMLIVPGRARRAWLLIVCGAGVAASAPTLLDVYPDALGGDLRSNDVRAAGVAMLLAALATGVAWASLRTAEARLQGHAAAGRLSAGTLVVLALVASGLLLSRADRVGDTVHRQYVAFVHLGVDPGGSNAPASSGSRLVSGAGNRYDYWRVAWRAFGERPLLGWGAGNYDGPYFKNRATQEDIRQPHSLELQTLSELGLAGGALLVVLFAGICGAVVVAVRRARRDPVAQGTTVAAVGILAAWLAHTSVDWIHLLPGVSAAALVAAAVLLGRRATDPEAAPVTHAQPGVLPAALVGLVLVLAGVSLTRQAAAEHFRGNAQKVLAADPARALAEADRALQLDPEAVSAYYVKAAALARYGDAAGARRTLHDAASREPRDFVTWALLGDVAVRTGDLDLARRYYERARDLNPRDPALIQLAEDPSSAQASRAG